MLAHLNYTMFLVRARPACSSGGNDHTPHSFAHLRDRSMQTQEGMPTSLACDVATYVPSDPCGRSAVVVPLCSPAPRRKMTGGAHSDDPARVRSVASRAQHLAHEEMRLNAS
jgi:hypothetical protein